MTDDGEALRDSVEKWLNSSGTTVELFTSRTLAARGLTVLQGIYLPDPETPSTSREIDVIAAREVQVGETTMVAAYLVVECKYSEKPWVIVTGRTASTESPQNYDRIATQHGYEWLEAAVAAHPAIRGGRIFQQNPRAGHALITAHVRATGDTKPTTSQKNNQDSAYAALFGATKAARAWADFLSDRKNRGNRDMLGIVFPVVLLRGSLFEASLNGDSITARSIEAGQVYWNHPSVNHPVLVDVVVDSHLDEFAGQFRETAEALVTYGKDAALHVNTSGIF